MKNPKCPNCSKPSIKYGTRKTKLHQIQVYLCKFCNKRFSLITQQNKTYPITTILKAISTYNLGYNLQQTQNKLEKVAKTKIPVSTISNWINQYKNICTYNKLRNKAIKLYTPKNIIFKQTLNHIQPYIFKYHKAKLEILFKDIKYNNQFINQSKFYEPIKNYLQKINTNKFPHHIFKEKTGSDAEIAQTDKLVNKTKNAITALEKQTNVHSPYADVAELKNIKSKKLIEQRASQIKFARLKIKKLEKTNLANKLAKLALNLATTNKDRHQAIQNFMLINDSTTIATELPVYLTNDDIKYFLKKGFILDFELNQNKAIPALERKSSINTSGSEAVIDKISDKSKNKIATPVTGHIDILQVRNNLIHILDYKPKAIKSNPIEQLTIYALALASRTKLDLHSFKCAWFDENSYFEFFPLHVVYERKKKKKGEKCEKENRR